MDLTLQLIGIAATLGLLWLVLTLLARFRGPVLTPHRLRVQQRLQLANGSQLVVVHWDGQEILLATGGQPCTVIGSRPVALELPEKARRAWAS